MRLWMLYAALVAAASVAAYELMRDDCSESDTGLHEDVLMSVDSDEGRIWMMQCLHCLRDTDGVLTPWIRTRTHPTPGSLKKGAPFR